MFKLDDEQTEIQNQFDQPPCCVVSESFISQMIERYPNFDVKNGIASMEQWLCADSKRRHAPQGMEKFIEEWLERVNKANGGRQ